MEKVAEFPTELRATQGRLAWGGLSGTQILRARGMWAWIKLVKVLVWSDVQAILPGELRLIEGG